MVDQATERTTIMASPEDCYAVAIDFERYPQWAGDIKQADILGRDASGRAVDVAYRVSAMGRSTNYTLRYFYGDDPLRLAWRLQSSDSATRLDGEYEFREVPCPDGATGPCTEVIYHLAVELKVPLPEFLKRRAESRIMHTALDELKSQAEGSARAEA